MTRPWLSVIIPAYREEARIAALLAHVAALPAPDGVEVIVADGDPERSTLVAIPSGLTLALISLAVVPLAVVPLATPKGRARQMNAGAAEARGDILLFLHADTRLPQEAFVLIQAALSDQGICGGAFSLAIEPEEKPAGPGLRFIAWAANLRARFTRAPYGDQAIFLRRKVFEAIGGYADVPLMEDLELMSRLRRRGLRIALLGACVATSGRRWEREGLLRCTGRNLLLRALYHLGVPPGRLAGYYK